MLLIGKYIFHPRLFPSLATLLLLPVLMRLGFWQLDRAEEKRVQLQQFESRLSEPAVDINQPAELNKLAAYQKVRLKGQFDTRHQFLLDNKVYHGKVGYQVLSAVKLPQQRQAILVNRGWIPMGSSREQLPEFGTPQGTVQIEGQLKYGTGIGVQLGEIANSTQGWPRVIQWVEPQPLAARLGYPLAPAVVLMDAKAEGGFVRDWYIKRIEPEKSTSYAVQWFALSLALLVIYFVVNTRKVEVEVKHNEF